MLLPLLGPKSPPPPLPFPPTAIRPGDGARPLCTTLSVLLVSVDTLARMPPLPPPLAPPGLAPPTTLRCIGTTGEPGGMPCGNAFAPGIAAAFIARGIGLLLIPSPPTPPPLPRSGKGFGSEPCGGFPGDVCCIETICRGGTVADVDVVLAGVGNGKKAKKKHATQEI